MVENHGELKIEGRAGGPLMTVSYWLTDPATGKWAIVDPTYQVLTTWSDRLASAPAPAAIYITHGHFDHTAGAADFLRRFPRTPVWVHPQSRSLVENGAINGSSWAGLPYEAVQPTDLYQEGAVIELGNSRLEILDAPGHCPGSVILKCGKQVIVGDVLFQGSVGRWDLPGADYDTLASSIRDKLMTLPNETIVYPGHGPATTIGEEKMFNPIVQKMMMGEAF